MENATLQNPMAIIEAEIERVMNAAPRSDYVRIPVQVAAACRTALAAQSEADDLRAEVRANALEEAAKVAENNGWAGNRHRRATETADDIAEAIRALIAQQAGQP